MKKVLTLFVLFLANEIYAQDIIVKNDGSTIISKVLEVGTNEIKYKKYSNQDGPLYSIAKADVLSINYENGEKELFGNSKTNDLDNMDSNDVTASKGQKEYILNAGTLIPLQNVNYTRAANLNEGQTVQFRVARDVEIGDMKIIPYGTSVKGIVYQAKKSSWWGTKGRLGIKINEIALPGGVTIPLNNGNVYVTGKNRTPLSVLLFLLVTWPACFITGSKAELPAGYEIAAETARPVVLKINNGRLVDTYTDNTISNQDSNKQRIVFVRANNGYKVRAIIQSEDDKYYYYKLESKPFGRTYKTKKTRVTDIIE